MNTKMITVVLYNNNNADVIIDGETLYVDRAMAYSFIRAARENMKEKHWSRKANGDQVYIYVK